GAVPRAAGGGDPGPGGRDLLRQDGDDHRRRPGRAGAGARGRDGGGGGGRGRPRRPGRRRPQPQRPPCGPSARRSPPPAAGGRRRPSRSPRPARGAGAASPPPAASPSAPPRGCRRPGGAGGEGGWGGRADLLREAERIAVQGRRVLLRAHSAQPLDGEAPPPALVPRAMVVIGDRGRGGAAATVRWFAPRGGP